MFCPTVVALFLAPAAAWLPNDMILRHADVSLQLSRHGYIEWERNCGDGDGALETDLLCDTAVLSRRTLFRGAIVSTIGACTANTCGCSGTCGCRRSLAANAYTIDKVEPEENDIYAVAQNQPGPLRVLWVGPGVMEIKTGAARNGVYKDLFKLSASPEGPRSLSPSMTIGVVQYQAIKLKTSRGPAQP